MKQNKKAKICFVIHIAGERKIFFYICDVITSPEKEKISANHYCHTRCARFRFVIAPAQSRRSHSPTFQNKKRLPLASDVDAESTDAETRSTDRRALELSYTNC